MNVSRTLAVRAALVAALQLCACTASAQFRFVAFGVEQRPLVGGGSTYVLETAQVGHAFFGVPNDAVSLTSPNGTVLTGVQNEAQFASFGELTSMLFGDWIATEHPTTGPDNTYTIKVASYSLSSVFSQAPVITSPSSGDVVPKDFVVKWTNGNAILRGYSVQGSAGVRVLNSDFGVDGIFSVGLHTSLEGPPPLPLNLTVYVQSTLNNLSITNRSSGVVGKFIHTASYFNSHSLPATYQVVPEPPSLALGVIIIGIGILHRRKLLPLCADK